MSLVSSLNAYRKNLAEELQIAIGTPQPRSVDHPNETVLSTNADKHKPDKKQLERYWEIYKNVPLVRQPIRSFASEVVGPGYYVETDDEEAKEELEEWLSKSAIVDGEINKDIRLLLKKSTVQREVKGTAAVEKVQDEDGELYGFKLIPAETLRAFTRPGQTLLLAPDDEFENSDSIFQDRSFYKTEDGRTAAYVQLNRDLGRTNINSDEYYVPFTRDKIIKLTRDSDTGEVFGTSRLAAVENRLESLLKKLEDNDKAIESLAHPFQLIQFGDDEDVWEPEEVKNFMNHHEQEDFEPGMKQGVQGNVDINTVSGEVAPIESFLNFDVNWIISEMPLPKYALGGFEEDVNQFVSRSQETRVEKQIQEARKEIENEWTPVLKQKAEEAGFDADVKFRIGDDPANLSIFDQIDAQEDGENTGESGTDFTRPPASSEQEGNNEDEELSEESEEMLRKMANHYLEE